MLALAWPIVLARATQSVVGFTDALFVAPLGEVELAAVTTGALNTFSVTLLPMGTVFILQSFAAQLRGRGDLGAVRRYAWYGLGIAGLTGLVSLVAIPLLGPALEWFGYERAVHDEMTRYMSIRLLSAALIVGSEALGNWYGGLGNTRVAMITGVTTMVTNVALCWLLVEPRLGLPGYGVAGSAWASVIATAIGFAVVATLFARGWGLDDDRLRGTIPPSQKQPLQMGELLRVLRFGLPNGVNWFLEFAAFMLFINVVVGHLGTTVLAAFNVVMQINSVSFMPAFGFTSAGAILVGEAIGRRAHDDVWPIVRRAGIATCLWMGAAGIAYLVAPGALIGMFRPRDMPAETLVEVGATMLVMSALWQLFDAMSLTFGESLRAAGDTTWCMIARIVLAWLVFTPLAWAAVLWWGGGVVTVMIAVIAYLAVLSAALAWRFASGRWKRIELVGHEPQIV